MRRTLHGRDADKRRLDGEHRLSRKVASTRRKRSLALVVVCARYLSCVRNYLRLSGVVGMALFASTPMAYLVTARVRRELWALLLFAGFVRLGRR